MTPVDFPRYIVTDESSVGSALLQMEELIDALWEHTPHAILPMDGCCDLHGPHGCPLESPDISPNWRLP